jgi:hypothetical protein
LENVPQLPSEDPFDTFGITKNIEGPGPSHATPSFAYSKAKAAGVNAHYFSFI